MYGPPRKTNGAIIEPVLMPVTSLNVGRVPVSAQPQIRPAPNAPSPAAGDGQEMSGRQLAAVGGPFTLQGLQPFLEIGFALRVKPGPEPRVGKTEHRDVIGGIRRRRGEISLAS